MFRLQTATLLALFSAALTGIAHAQTESGAAPQPTPTPKSQYYVSGDYLFTPNSKNQFNPYGINGSNTFSGRAGAEHAFGKLAVMAEGTYDHYQYLHETGPVATIGGGQTVVPTFYAHNTDWDGRLGVGLQSSKLFLVASYGQRRNNYGYPNLQGVGFGIEKLPDFGDNLVSYFGSYLWYPRFGAGNTLQYGMYKYQAGLAVHPKDSRIPVYAELGYMGDYAYNKLNAPSYFNDSGVFAGLGLHF
jgi:hypothetical protein